MREKLQTEKQNENSERLSILFLFLPISKQTILRLAKEVGVEVIGVFLFYPFI